MNEEFTNEVVEEVVEKAMTTKSNGGKTAGILLIGMGLGVGAYTLIKKAAAKIRDKKTIVVEQTTDEEPEEENSTEE